MAIGTITIPSGMSASTANTTWGNKKVRFRTVQLSSGANYATGGSAITPPQVGLSKVIEMVLTSGAAPSTDGTTARTVHYRHSTGKLLVYTTGSAEAANNSDQSDYAIRLIFVGT
jgi:hypothetical protein